jgi:phage gpG-like protein
MQPDVRREVSRALKEGAVVVARASGPLAARRTGALAGSFKPGASQMKAYVRSRLPYAGVLEYGGTIKPKGAPVVIKAHPAATLALERNQEKIVDHIGDAIERVASTHGWS